MAEALVAAVLRKAVDVGVDLGVQAGSRLYWVSEDVDWIEREMRCIQSYIADAQAKQASDSRVANLVNEIEGLARHVIDILEKLPPQNSSSRGFLKRVACFIPYVHSAHVFALEMAKIRRRVEEIDRRRRSYGILDSASVSECWDLRRSYLYADEPEVVGLDDECEKLEKRLLDDQLVYGVVAIVGMPGLGKTTLGKRIYKHVQPRFDCSAMVYVSREARVGELLLHIARQVGCPDLGEEWSREGPEGKLCSYLRDKKYVILLDDIWDVETWDALRLGFPSEPKSGTRIIITSRDTAVGRYIGGESSIHEMKPLAPDQSWKLFCNQVMMPEHSAETTYPKEQIVETCGGVPLSIVVIAGVLRERGTITNQHCWTEVLEDIRHQHYGQQDRCTRFVSLSYDNLPIPLKDCFLYLGLFPKGHEILAFDLINMWVAEKFVLQQDHEEQADEDVAERYLNTLVSRNLVQVASRRCSGRIRSCRIHDILHNFCVLEANEKRFFRRLDSMRSSSGRSVLNRVQRVAINFNTDLNLENNISFSGMSHIRALVCFKTTRQKDIRFCDRLITHFPRFSLLRVLNLELKYSHPNFPTAFWNLNHLRYIRLRGATGLTFPSKISRLKNLQVLDVLKCSPVFFPQTILRMKQMRHLLLPYWPSRGAIIPQRSWDDFSWFYLPVKVCLPNLQTLHMVSSEDLERCRLFHFTSLRKLGIFDVSEVLINRLCCSMDAFQKLENLFLHTEFRLFERLDVSRLNLSGYCSLRRLRIKAPWGTLPRHQTFPPNLSELSLSSNKIVVDPMMQLKWLPGLKVLKLKNSHLLSAAQLMDCSGPEAFPQLQMLHIENVSNLRELISDDHIGLPKLEEVVIRNCIPLTRITGKILMTSKSTGTGTVSLQMGQSRHRPSGSEQAQHTNEPVSLQKDRSRHDPSSSEQARHTNEPVPLQKDRSRHDPSGSEQARHTNEPVSLQKDRSRHDPSGSKQARHTNELVSLQKDLSKHSPSGSEQARQTNELVSLQIGSIYLPSNQTRVE
nr:disease resistance protein RPH8A-like [Ipomoea trifida]